MPKYPMIATVERRVTDTIQLTIDAEDEYFAYLKARKVLDRFPESHDEDGVSFCYVDKRQYELPNLLTLEDAVEDANIG